MKLDRVKFAARAAEIGLTQTEIAKRAGITRVTVCSAANGHGLAESSAKKIAAAMGVSVSELEGGSTDATIASGGNSFKQKLRGIVDEILVIQREAAYGVSADTYKKISQASLQLVLAVSELEADDEARNENQ